MRPQPEIDAEIAELERLAPLIQQTNAFGESNRDLIDAQIRTLKEKIFDDDDLADTFLNDDDEDGVDDGSFEIESSARDAAQWATEESNLKPSTDWESLVP